MLNVVEHFINAEERALFISDVGHKSTVPVNLVVHPLPSAVGQLNEVGSAN